MLSLELGRFKMKYVILDFGVDVKILPKKTLEIMGKPTLVWSPIQLRLANKYKVFLIGRLMDIRVNVDVLNLEKLPDLQAGMNLTVKQG